LRSFALVIFEVTANYLFFKIPASTRLAVKYRPSGHPGAGAIETVLLILLITRNMRNLFQHGDSCTKFKKHD